MICVSLEISVYLPVSFCQLKEGSAAFLSIFNFPLEEKYAFVIVPSRTEFLAVAIYTRLNGTLVRTTSVCLLQIGFTTGA